MSEPKSFPKIVSEWCGAAIAVITLLGIIFGGVKYGFGFLSSIERGLENVSAVRLEQTELRKYVQDTNNRITKLDTTWRDKFEALEKEIAKKADKKGSRQ